MIPSSGHPLRKIWNTIGEVKFIFPVGDLNFEFMVFQNYVSLGKSIPIPFFCGKSETKTPTQNFRWELKQSSPSAGNGSSLQAIHSLESGHPHGLDAALVQLRGTVDTRMGSGVLGQGSVAGHIPVHLSIAGPGSLPLALTHPSVLKL
eukprot:Gb_15531 [translate_table: standard]